MGIDIYLNWDEQTKDEKSVQYCGFDTTMGHVGYLREAYHGGPYATRVLVPEAFDDGDDIDPDDEDRRGVHIPATTLRDRLPATIDAAVERAQELYPDHPVGPDVMAFCDFVALAERLEAQGANPRVYASY